jgi:hypothetical protein
MTQGSSVPPTANVGAGETQPTCCHCFEPCSEDSATSSDDDDKVYVCDTCLDKFYREWQEAEQAECDKLNALHTRLNAATGQAAGGVTGDGAMGNGGES